MTPEPHTAIRPVDRSRAIRLVAFQLQADTELWARTVHEIVNDDREDGDLDSLIAVLLVLSNDLAGALADIHGTERASNLLSAMLAPLAEGADRA